MEKQGFVYIMASRRNGTLYIGATSDLAGRACQHREGLIEGFTKENRCTQLVWFEGHSDIEAARRRELQMKKWKRLWKLRVIETMNRDWIDLYPSLFAGTEESRDWAPAFAGAQEQQAESQ